MQVNMLEAKSTLSQLVEVVASGRLREVTIARNGRPAAKLVAINNSSTTKIGAAKDMFEMPDNIDAANAEMVALFEGGL